MSWTVAAQDTPKVGDPLRVSWRAARRLPSQAAVYLVIAVPGEARFEVGAAGLKRDDNRIPLPALPGFLALPAGAAAPLDIRFGLNKTRALIPLHQPGSKLSGSFTVRTFAQGSPTVESALVLSTACGEHLLTPSRRQTFNLAPGAPEIIVQDPYDLEVPPKALVSNNRRYLLQVFDGRYRVYEVATGLKLVDRNGHNPNFSPTSRFVAADIGDHDGRDFEVIDLVSREVIATPIGRFIGWTEGDAYLIDGRAENGIITLRPTLISRAQIASRARSSDQGWSPELGAVGGKDDGMQIDFSGACHACSSWTDTNLTVDLDRALAVLSGKGLFEEYRIFELASGHSECCKSAGEVEPYLAQLAGGSLTLRPGWHAKQPILFSHVFDPVNHPGRKWWDATDKKTDWYRVAVKLGEQLHRSQSIDPKMQSRLAAGIDKYAARREDWRTRARAVDGVLDQVTEKQALLNLTAFGLSAMAPLRQEAMPFSNSPASEDLAARDRWGKNADQVKAEIERRTKPFERRLLEEFPALKAHLSEFAARLQRSRGQDRMPGTKFILENNLEGLWRWEIDGRSLWLLQLLIIEGSSSTGSGALILLDRTLNGGGATVSLSAALPGFWNGSYGNTAHQTRVKPQLFPNGYLVAASVSSGTIAVYDTKTGQAKALFRDIPQRDLLQDLQLSADARFVIQVNSDGQFFLHRLSEAKLVLSGRMVDGEVILYTPEGYYWSSYEGAHFVQLRFPGVPGFFTFQQFEAELNRPDIVKAHLKGGPPAPPPQLTSPPELTLRLTGTAVVVQARSAVGLSRLRFYHDGHMVQDVPVTGLAVEEKVSLPPAGNARRLTVLAADVHGFVSSQTVALNRKGDKRSKLYAVIAAVDRYADKDLQLDYATSDASQLGAALRETAPRYYAQSNATILLNERATGDAIAAALEKAVAEAQASDTLVFSFAGHGVPDSDGKYLLTPAEFRLADISGTGLSWTRLASILERAKARVVVILDACHSGLSGAQGLATNDDVVQALVSGARAPMLVLAASKGREYALESAEWGGGVFTFALTKILRDPAYDLDKDGAIEVSELYRGLREIVTRETGGKQSPWLVRRDLIGDFALF